MSKTSRYEAKPRALAYAVHLTRTRRRILVGLAVVFVCIVAGSTVLYRALPRIAVSAMSPKQPFDAAKTPTVPDYQRDTNWLALPSTKDEADSTISALPAATAVPPVDVFYVHSTSSVAAQWNASVDDAVVRAASIRGGTLIQGSVFSACCNVYAPEYRQASGVAFMNRSVDGDRAIDVAYADIVAAFVEFERRTSSPLSPHAFIVAGHSQGSVLLTRLVREVIATDSARKARLVAAYLIGAPVADADLGGLHACHSPNETGCVVTYNARGAGHARNGFEIGGVSGAPESQRLCVNPVLGTDAETLVPRAQHHGAVFFDSVDTPSLLANMLASQCVGGRLVVTELQPLPKRDFASEVLLAVMGRANFHPIEYQLFYADLRADAARRVARSASVTHGH